MRRLLYLRDREKLEAHSHRTNDRQFLQTSRGFHWINEKPFNR